MHHPMQCFTTQVVHITENPRIYLDSITNHKISHEHHTPFIIPTYAKFRQNYTWLKLSLVFLILPSQLDHVAII